jgi:hypothetical protein
MTRHPKWLDYAVYPPDFQMSHLARRLPLFVDLPSAPT